MRKDWRRVIYWYEHHGFKAAAAAARDRESDLYRLGDPRVIFMDILRYQFG